MTIYFAEAEHSAVQNFQNNYSSKTNTYFLHMDTYAGTFHNTPFLPQTILQ